MSRVIGLSVGFTPRLPRLENGRVVRPPDGISREGNFSAEEALCESRAPEARDYQIPGTRRQRTLPENAT
jgi:hypothetical protein